MAGTGGLGSYQAQLSQAQTDYGSVIAGYQNTLSGQQSAQQGIQSGYNALGGQVANTLGYGGTPWGVAAPAAQSIADVYQGQMGSAQQNLINSGLGNSTVLQSVQRGIGLDAAKAYGGLGAQLAQTYAGYESQLGLAGLNYANQANQQNTALQQAQLGYMGAYHGQGYGQRQPMGGGGIGAPSSGGSGPQGIKSPSSGSSAGYQPQSNQGYYGGQQSAYLPLDQINVPGATSSTSGGYTGDAYGNPTNPGTMSGSPYGDIASGGYANVDYSGASSDNVDY
jgi:hypothetical protein